MSNSTKSITRSHRERPHRDRAVALPAARLAPRELLSRASHDWGLSRPLMLSILLAPFLVAASGVAAALMGKTAYQWLTEEDQIAETLQVLCYAAAWGMCLLVIRYHIKSKQPLLASLYVVLCFGLLFLIGEEVSWGQRIFAWDTPESMAAINKQEETNLHNIDGVGHSFKWIQMLVGAYGTVLPILFLRPGWFARYQKLIDAVVPHWSLILFFLPMFVWKLYRNLGATPERFYYVITNYNEVVELILAMGFCLFLVFQLRKCRRAAAAETVSP